MDEPISIKNAIAIAKPLLPTQDNNFESFRNLLDQVCSQVAERFRLYNQNGKPRKATIIDALAKSTCLACIAKKLSAQATANDVDALYKECHTLAVNILVEELYNLLSGMGYKVMISTEADLEYGKADVIITITRYGINLRRNANELLVEVKTGNSLSLSQLFRYLLDERGNTIVVWRIRRRQVLIFNAQNIRTLLMEFTRMVSLRGSRLLSFSQLTCQHTQQSDYQPTQEELQKMFQDFAKAMTETLPYVLKAILEKLDIKNALLQESNR
jgi:hypothetical protein